MKKLCALTLTLTLLIPFALLTVSAGPERFEAKTVAPPPPPLCDWTGFYIGGHAGWRGGDNVWVNADTESFDELNPEVLNPGDETSGIFGGLQVGYNRQINSWFVIGFEVSGSYSGEFDNTESFPEPGNEVKHFKTENDWS